MAAREQPAGGAVVGALQLGPSIISPVLVDWIDNGGGASWLTLENRLALPVGVVPAYSEGSPDQPALFTVPGLHRSTVPIDPAKGVQVAVLGNLQAAGLNSPSPLTVFQHHVKRTLPYMLHDAGGAPTEPLYPVDALVPAVLNVGQTGISIVNLWVGPSAPPTFVPALQLFNGPPDTCLVAASILLEPGSTFGTLGAMTAAFWTDLDDPAGPAQGGFEVFTTGDTTGDSATFSCHGCQALQLQVPTAGDVANYTITAWVGVPAS